MARILMIAGVVVTVAWFYGQLAETGADLVTAPDSQAGLALVALQEHELKTALELYYLDYGQYPTVSDSAVVGELYQAGYLKSQSVKANIDYEVSGGGRNYQLVLH